MIRTAATIGFAVAPCSLGFVIIAVSEQIIRAIMVGDDPELLVSELQNRYPNDAIEVLAAHEEWVARAADQSSNFTTIAATTSTAATPIAAYTMEQTT